MTLPHTRHLDALVAKYVLKLEDVRLGWAFGSDAQPQWSSNRDYYGRDYIYRAREATETDAGYERVPDYASDGNAMLGLIDWHETRGVYTATQHCQDEHGRSKHVSATNIELRLRGIGRANTLPEAACWAYLDLETVVKRWDGDQSFDVRRELQRLEDAYQEAINQKGVEHA